MKTFGVDWCTRFRAAIVLSLALAACHHGVPSGPARRVILVTCDTLRADHLGCYGYARPTSPNVDAFAAGAIVYEEAYSSAPMTVPAIASLLSGRPPDEIGIAAGNRCLLPPEVETLPEILSREGILTAAIVSNWVLRRGADGMQGAGVQQGFGWYDDDMRTREPNRGFFERTAPDTTDAAIAWLSPRREHPATPFLLWVHYQDPHGPYTPPERLKALFRTDAIAELELPIGTNQKGKGQIPAYQAFGNERRPGQYRDRYDAEIRYFDEGFGRLVAWLRENGMYEDSLIILTSDHGESLGEHGYWFCHGENLHREEVRVPLLVRSPARTGLRAGRRSELAGHLDLWPTILEALGVAAPARPGVSLLAERLPGERLLVQTRAAPGTTDRWEATSDGRFRLIVERGTSPRLFDVRNDPSETHDLASSDPERVSRLVAHLKSNLAAGEHSSVQGFLFRSDPETLESLRALGYVDGDRHD